MVSLILSEGVGGANAGISGKGVGNKSDAGIVFSATAMSTAAFRLCQIKQSAATSMKSLQLTRT